LAELIKYMQQNFLSLYMGFNEYSNHINFCYLLKILNRISFKFYYCLNLNFLNFLNEWNYPQFFGLNYDLNLKLLVICNFIDLQQILIN